MTEFKELRENHLLFPIDIAEVPDSAVPIPERPKVIDGNKGAAFGLSPIDEVRLSQLFCFMREVGFIVQNCSVELSIATFAMCTIKFGQAMDRRLTEQEQREWLSQSHKGYKPIASK